jgi:hypothetical protein
MKPDIPNQRSATDPEAQPIRLADIANDTTIRRHVVQFSGGIGSWAASERVIPLAATVQRMTLLIADTHAEDEDLWRFAEEAALGFGLPLTKVEDGRDPWQVFEHEGFLGNSHVAPCSRHLKQIPARRWLEAHCDPTDTVIHVGIDWTETHRIPAIVKGWAPWRVAFPMTEPPYLGKDQMLARAASLDLTPPRLYRKGFIHNNCGGACVRGGQAAWAHLLEVFPDRFAAAEANEARFRARHGNVSILKDRRGGTTTPLPLSELRRRIETAPQQDALFDAYGAYDQDDWGGCGCMGDFADNR